MSAAFVVRQDTPLSSGLSNGVAADFTGDGVADLIGVDVGLTGSAITLFLSPGRGDGTFGDPQIAATPTQAAPSPLITSVRAIDLNGDERLDVVVSFDVRFSGSPYNFVFINSGNGTFESALNAYGSVDDTADINSDGRTDLVFGLRSLRGQPFFRLVPVAENNADGTYSFTSIPLNDQPDGSNSGLTTAISSRSADFNGDNRDDLVVSTGSTNDFFSSLGGLSVLLSNGNGTFTTALTERGFRDRATFVSDNIVSAFTLGDFNGDGRTDILYATGSEVRLLPSNGDGTFGFRQDFATTISTSALTAADLNGDGRDDVIATDGRQISVLLANPDGSLGPRTLYDTAGPPTLADLNGDGSLDLVGFGPARDTYTFQLNDGTGRFSDPQPIAGANGSPSVVDLDRDGRQEILAFAGGGYAVFRVVDDPAGTAGDDTVTVIRGAAAYDGQGGDDRITGSTEADTLSGGAGADTILAGAGADIVDGGADADLLLGNQGADILSGGAGADTIFAGSGDDLLDGGADADLLLGNQGADTLRGGAGADTLYGGQDADWLFGDGGDDVLSADLGADRYVFGANSGADRILGFSQASGDRLDLQGQGYGFGTPNGGNAVLTLSGGGTIELAGIAQAQVDQGFFAS